MRKVNVGVVGCGNISGIYLTNLTGMFADRVNVVAVCDLIPEKALAAQKEYGIPKAYFTDEEMNGFDEVLNPDDTQCVINIENGNQDLPPADAIESITFRLVMTDEAGETVLAETETLSAPLNW